ncbi:MAG: peptide ABC transporter substrate-binding protein [Spirochaetes bacterium]|nr:MAG: peptide ABC transporter substrate-binding protein [Spirochaetota bacterium]
MTGQKATILKKVFRKGEIPLEDNILLRVENLKKYFPVKRGIFSRVAGYIQAVDGVSFFLRGGEILGLVGESGCGKTTLGRVVLRLLPATEGEVYFEGTNLMKLSSEKLRSARRHMQIIFQDPFASLNPRMNIENLIGEPLLIHGVASGKEKEKRVCFLLEKVGLEPGYRKRFPHEFSGGQRQRIGIARALALDPKLIVCDEPVSALDVAIQAQIINLLEDLQAEFGFSYLFIAHDLSVIKHITDRVAVMYLGKIVELAETDELYLNPLHPYTEALLSAVPVPDPTLERKRIILEGDVPSPINPPSGCRFRTRCVYAGEICKMEEPLLKEMGKAHEVACHFPERR